MVRSHQRTQFPHRMANERYRGPFPKGWPRCAVVTCSGRAIPNSPQKGNTIFRNVFNDSNAAATPHSDNECSAVGQPICSISDAPTPWFGTTRNSPLNIPCYMGLMPHTTTPFHPIPGSACHYAHGCDANNRTNNSFQPCSYSCVVDHHHMQIVHGHKNSTFTYSTGSLWQCTFCNPPHHVLPLLPLPPGT